MDSEKDKVWSVFTIENTDSAPSLRASPLPPVPWYCFDFSRNHQTAKTRKAATAQTQDPTVFQPEFYATLGRRLPHPWPWYSITSHYDDVRMGAIASKITSLTIVYSIVYSDANQRKHQSSASLAFVGGIHSGQVNSPHKWPVTRKMFPFDDVIMYETGIIPQDWRDTIVGPIYIKAIHTTHWTIAQYPSRRWPATFYAAR